MFAASVQNTNSLEFKLLGNNMQNLTILFTLSLFGRGNEYFVVTE